MSLTSENGTGMVMPVSPMTGSYPYPVYGGNDNNGFGMDAIWLIVLFLLAGNGGWGGFGGFGNGGDLYPWMNQSEVTTNGFQNLSTQNQITAVQSDLGDIQAQLCNGFAGVNATVNSGFANAETAANARQMANMQQAFANQTTMSQGFYDVSSQLASCCCDNRLATANLSADIAREACATRTNDTQNTQSILNVINGGIQSIKDQLNQDKIDEKNDTIAQLRQEVLFARGKDSQDVQTADIINGTYNRLSQCPVGTTPVYGNQPIFTCNNNNGNCGCGCNV